MFFLSYYGSLMPLAEKLIGVAGSYISKWGSCSKDNGSKIHLASYLLESDI